jgi:hypothetical protein
MMAAEVARRLPDVETLRNRARSLAMIEAIVSPEWESRYYSYDSAWGPGEHMASMRTGGGDNYSIVFSPKGVYIRGFDHESSISPYRRDPMSPWPGLIDLVPEDLEPYASEPAFMDRGVPLVTVCFWRLIGQEGGWHHGSVDFPQGAVDAGGANWLFDLLLDGTPESYIAFAHDYYGVELAPEAVRSIYRLDPLTAELVSSLNPEVDPSELDEDIEIIGYPQLVD